MASCEQPLNTHSLSTKDIIKNTKSNIECPCFNSWELLQSENISMQHSSQFPHDYPGIIEYCGPSESYKTLV